ncbi:inorganic diphosphatase, partial [[Ruminococcus] torques]|uniref:DHHA2 domain-containing protein n=1 Tax=[Ruminococcus] torques TaxID=33039 RepID=UPI0027B9568B
TARKLAQTAGVEIDILSQEMFRAGSNLKGKSAQDICFLDFKKFTVNETGFGVGQVNSMSSDELEGIKKKVKPYLEKACADSGVNMIFFLLTNILTESSELLCGGPEAKE